MSTDDPFEEPSSATDTRDARLRVAGVVVLVVVSAAFATAVLWPTHAKKREATIDQLRTLLQEVTDASVNARPAPEPRPLAELMGDAANTDDAWGNPIQYQLICPTLSTITTYGDLFGNRLAFTSFGEDGRAGGVGRDEDIVVYARFLQGEHGC